MRRLKSVLLSSTLAISAVGLGVAPASASFDVSNADFAHGKYCSNNNRTFITVRPVDYANQDVLDFVMSGQSNYAAVSFTILDGSVPTAITSTESAWRYDEGIRFNFDDADIKG